MPDYRVFKRSLTDNPQFGMLGITAQHLLLMLHLLADDQGRLQGHPAWIRSRAYTYQDVTLDAVARDLEALEKAGMIIQYTNNGVPLIQITGWWEQQDRMQWAAPSAYPPPDGWQDRERYRANNKVIARNWRSASPPASHPRPPSSSPPDPPDGSSQPPSPAPDEPEKDGKPLGKALPKGLPKAQGDGEPKAQRKRKRMSQSQKRQESSSPSPPEEGGPGGGTAPGGGEGGGIAGRLASGAPVPKPETARVAPQTGLQGAAVRRRRTKHPPPEDPRVRLLHAAGITNGKVPKILGRNTALDDILAELARCYDPRSNVRRPELIAPRHILAGESPPATYRQPRLWREHIPEAVLEHAGLSDWLDERIAQADRERASAWFPAEDAPPQATDAPAPSKPPPFDGPEGIAKAWQAAMGILQMDMPKAAFDTWVQPAYLRAYEEPDVLVIGASSAYARAWLEDRLAVTLRRILSGILDRDVQVRFEADEAER